jgi:hypothetical protein
MAAPNILDPRFVNSYSQMRPEHQRQGVDILKAKCAEIEAAGSLDAKLDLMGHANDKSLPEDQRKYLVAGGLDQCYWQLTKFLRVRQSCYSPPFLKKKVTHLLVILAVFNPFSNPRSSSLHRESSCSLRN